MTQVERLIRNLCEERRLSLIAEEKTAITKIKDSIPWGQLPSSTQKLVTEWIRLQRRQNVIERLIQRRGLRSYGFHIGGALNRIGHDQEVRDTRTNFNRRRELIQQLRTDVTILTLGKSASESAAALKELQRRLAKI